MAFQPIGRGTQRPPMSGVTRVHVGDCTLPKRMLRVYGGLFGSLSTVDLEAWKRKGYLGNPGKGSRRRYTGV